MTPDEKAAAREWLNLNDFGPDCEDAEWILHLRRALVRVDELEDVIGRLRLDCEVDAYISALMEERT